MKTDLTKTDKAYYTATATPAFTSIGQASYISIAGKGDPSGPLFMEHIHALYPVAYAIKFACKEQGNDFVVPKLEGLWWFDEEKFGSPSAADAPVLVPRSEWDYRLLIRMPGFVTPDQLDAAIAKAVGKGIAAASQVTWHMMEEGNCVQILHTGPYSTEPESLAKLQDFITSHQLQRNGRHHEIYLSDFRKTPPEKLRTILREPVK